MPVKRWPSRGETARPRARERCRISVDPSVPAASTTTSAHTNDAGAANRVRPSAVDEKLTVHGASDPSGERSTVRTEISQKMWAP